MVDFSHLKTLDVTAQSEAEYIFDDIPGEPSIWFRPMVEANTDFMNERVRLAVEKAEKAEKETRKKRREKALSTDRLEDDRETDRVLMARTCAIRWGTPFADAEGKTHELNEEHAYAFFSAMPSYIFDSCRGWVANVYNFVDKEAVLKMTADQAEALGKPSPSA